MKTYRQGDVLVMQAMAGIARGAEVPRENGVIVRIDQERNAEMRRVLVTRYGVARYLRDAGAKEIGRDAFGTLLRREQDGDEPIVMVSVLNSTPEPDGSTKEYLLRVPPDMQTAHQAVAWTFGLTPADYHPEVET